MSHIAQRILDQRASSLRPPLGVVPAGAISLALGEPDFPTPEPIANAGNKAVSEGNTRYTDQHGLRSLREKLVSALPSGPANKDWDADNVVVTHGATAALGAIFFALLSPGDKVVIPEPAYSLYADLVTLAGGEVVYAKLGKDLHFDIEELKEKLPGAKAIVFSNPSNPNGIVHTKHELEELGKLLEGSSTLVISDEAYSSLTYSGHDFTSALEVESLAPRTLYVQTFSKKYAMTGWRVGYVAGDK
ncbi:TPA: pyridoxal phosphate-dependent aminotransferase, partial [Corynebacterium striatum]|nr:pyridoxal phosphate-dependent aminotransferase [Corynebacterium striatum]